MTTTTRGETFNPPVGRTMGHFFCNLPGGIYRVVLKTESFEGERRRFLDDLDTYITETGFDAERCVQLYSEYGRVSRAAINFAQKGKLDEARALANQSETLDRMAQDMLLPVYRAMRVKGYAHKLLVE